MAVEPLAQNTIVIDLGSGRGEPETYGAPTRSTVPGWFGPALAVLLVLVGAAGSAAPPPPALTPLLTVAIGPADTFAVTGERLLSQDQGTLASYRLGTGEPQWESEARAPTYRLRTAAGLVLLRPWTSYNPGEPSTIAVALTDGGIRWRYDGTVTTVAGSEVLLGVSAVRSGSANRRVQGPIRALDPATGAPRWQVDVPNTAVAMGVPGGDAGSRLLLVHDDRTAAVHDLGTGRRLAATEFPTASYGPENPAVSGGKVLLRHVGYYGSVVTAYDPVTLREVWERPAGQAYEVRDCGPVACMLAQDGVRAIDQATGMERWFAPWRSLQQHGSLSVAYHLDTGSDPVAVVEPSTGRVLTDLTGWQIIEGETGDHLLVTRKLGEDRSVVGIARPGLPRPMLLADLPPHATDCRAVAGILVCRAGGGELSAWSYRPR